MDICLLENVNAGERLVSRRFRGAFTLVRAQAKLTLEYRQDISDRMGDR